MKYYMYEGRVLRNSELDSSYFNFLLGSRTINLI